MPRMNDMCLAKICTTVFVLLLALNQLLAQEDSLQTFQEYIDQAKRYSELQQHAESIEQLNRAIDMAEEMGWEEKRIDLSITVAETMRKTRDFERGVEILYQLQESEKYPKIHVRKLGRLAALYSEWGYPHDGSHNDSVVRYLDEAIRLAAAGNFKLEEASLKNELGHRLSGADDPRVGLNLFLEAAQLFETHGDTHNYVGTLTNAMGSYMRLQDHQKVDSIANIIHETLTGKNWYSAEITFYTTLSNYAGSQGDSIAKFRWAAKAIEGHMRYREAISTQQMSDLRVVYETEKFQDEAEQRAEELEKQQARMRELIIYLTVMVLLVIGVIALLFRERSLKQKVKVANEKYHMLLVESNHRIKNNLQMIISMLEYASKDLDDQDSAAFQRMSGKIHTISALHKHLYLDVHNERVQVDTYFGEIISLYEAFSAHGFSIEKQIVSAEVKSERIVYFGLIFNEMLANTIEHNQSAQKKAHITVSKHEDRFVFNYQDGSNWESDVEQGTGSVLIRQLIQRVGGTNYQFDPSRGLYQFEFHA